MEELTSEWVRDATRAFIEKRSRWTQSTAVHPGDIWMDHQHSVPGGDTGKAAALARLAEVMLRMAQAGDTFDRRQVYLYWPCPNCGESLYSFREWPIQDPGWTFLECDCGFVPHEPPGSLDALEAEFHVTTTQPESSAPKPVKSKSSWAERQFKQAEKDAARQWGAGWALLSDEQQKGAIALRIIAAILACDDEATDSAHRAAQFRALAELLYRSS